MKPEIEFEKMCVCDIKKFTINGKDADVDDFGSAYDHDIKNKPDYGCGYYKFTPHKYPKRATLEKYGIEIIDWFEIVEMLENELDIGECCYCE